MIELIQVIRHAEARPRLMAFTCFQGSFRRALFFLEKSRKRVEMTFRSTVRYVVTAHPSIPKRLNLGPILNLFLVSAHAKCLRGRRRKGGRAV